MRVCLACKNGLKTLHKYLAWQVLASLSLTVVVFTFVLLVGNLLKEVLSLLVTGGARFSLVLEAVGLIIPFLWVYALPMGLLTATLLVFGRFSADQELTAARASGVSLVSLVPPILFISLVCCGLSAWINLELGPQSRVAYKNLIYRARYEMASVQLPENTVIHDFPGYVCTVGKNRDGDLTDILIIQFDTDTNKSQIIQAHTGRLEVDLPNQLLNLYLTNAVSEMAVGSRDRHTSGKTYTLQIDLKTATNQVYHPKISDMTYGQLRNEIRELAKFPPVPGQKGDLTLPARVELNREIAFSFASFGFALIGIPLGIRVHRRETNIGIAVALGLAVVYYSFILLGESLSARPEFHPELILWIPNFIFQAVGGVLLWRANRGF
jgi:lipopolysaccharide export system permease protein